MDHNRNGIDDMETMEMADMAHTGMGHGGGDYMAIASKPNVESKTDGLSSF